MNKYARLLSGFAVAVLVLSTIIFVLPVLPAYAISDAYWVGGSGNWTDNATHWASVSGGVPGAALPGGTTHVHFDANSFTGAGQSVIVDAAANCLDMDWTGATNTPTLSGHSELSIWGSLTFITDMNVTKDNTWWLRGPGTITTAGQSFPDTVRIDQPTSDILLADTFNNSHGIIFTRGILNTNGQTVNLSTLSTTGANARTLTLGASTINITSSWEYTGSGLTLTANTATINLSGTANFIGGGITTYNTVNLNGTAHTISGNNTFATLSLPVATTQTISFTDSSNQTVTNLNLSGSLGHYHTLQGTGAGGWSVNKTAGTVSADYINITNSHAEGGATFNANGASVNGGGNTGWNFPLTVSTGAATNVGMDINSHATLNGVLTDMGGNVPNTVSFEWGYSTSYGHTVGSQSTSVPGSFTFYLTGFDPNQTVHYRFNTLSGVTTGNGADQTFSITSSSPSSPSFVAFNFANGVVPVLFVAFIIFIVMALALGGAVSPLMAIILMAVAILMGTAFLQGIQALLNAMWGG